MTQARARTDTGLPLAVPTCAHSRASRRRRKARFAWRTRASSSTSSRSGTASERAPATYWFSSKEGSAACSPRLKQNAR